VVTQVQGVLPGAYGQIAGWNMDMGQGNAGVGQHKFQHLFWLG
jgi:hypothetical protein